MDKTHISKSHLSVLLYWFLWVLQSNPLKNLQKSCSVLEFFKSRKDKFFSFSNNGEEGSWRSDEDFDEEDVWGVVKSESSSPTNIKKLKDISFVSTPRPLPSAPKLVPSSKTNGGGSYFVPQSAPVNIPDWSKVYNNKGSDNGSWGEEGDVGFDSDVDGDDEHCKIPLHEWVAKKLARSQISSFSVFEGVGRTLKGRDLSKVRNAVLTRTGFLE